MSHDVPVSIIAADPAVMDRAADWGWHGAGGAEKGGQGSWLQVLH
ncbi:hypothetical protein [Mycobacterium sp. JS623]|nr:hypothetical protein [Mycobacterium sp. JS623]